MPDYRKLSQIADEAAAKGVKPTDWNPDGGTPAPALEPAPATPPAPPPAPLVGQPTRRPLHELADQAAQSGIDPTEWQGGPETVSEQAARGLPVRTPPPNEATLGTHERELFAALVDLETRSNRASTANQVAWDEIQAMKKVAPGNDSEGLTETISKAAQSVTEPGSLANEAAQSFGPRWFRSNHGHYYTVASTPVERRTAADYGKSLDIKSGTDPVVADRRWQARLESNAPLLLPTADNPTIATDEEGSDRATPLVNTYEQGLTDVASGVAETARDVGSLAIRLPQLGSKASIQMATAIGVPTTWTATARHMATYVLPSPTEAARDWLASHDNPYAQAMASHLTSTIDRGGSAISNIITGSAEMLNDKVANIGLPDVVRAWATVDPNDIDGVVDMAVNVATSVRPPTPAKSAGNILEEGATRIRELPSTVAHDFETLPVADAALTAAGDVLSAASTPVMDAFGAVSTNPEMKDTALGWWMRVPLTAASGLVTTQGARIADYMAVHALGAESYRRHRAPDGSPEMSAFEAFAPVLFTGSGIHDYLATVRNGDAITTESMRLMNTLAYGGVKVPEWAPDASKEFYAWVVPRLAYGGSLRDLGIQVGMIGDLTAHLDSAPHIALGGLHDVGRFHEAYGHGRAAGMGTREAARFGAASIAPSLTHTFAMEDPAYKAAFDESSAAVAATQQGLLAAQGRSPSDAARVTTIDRDIVRHSAARAFANRAVDAGANPTERGVGRLAREQADRVREILTTLRVEAPAVIPPVPTPGVGPSPEQANTLTRMRYTADDIGRMDSLEAQRRIDEAIGPDDVDGSMLNPERGPAIPEIMQAADTMRRVARAEESPPLAVWSEEASKEADPARRARLHVQDLAAHWGLDPDNVLVTRAIQAALSFYDPKSGQFRTFPVPTPEWVERRVGQKADGMDYAFRRLRDARPEQVWHNVAAFERGETVSWSNDVAAEAQANRLSRSIPQQGRPDARIRKALPAEHPLVRALGEKEPGTGAPNKYQRLALAGRDWFLSLLDAQGTKHDAWKDADTKARQFYRDRAPGGTLPPDADLPAHLESLRAILTGRDVAQLDKHLARLRTTTDALVRAEATTDAAQRWLAARMTEARPETRGQPMSVPHRERVRQEAIAAGAKKADVDRFLGLFDRAAAQQVKLGLWDAADGFYSMLRFEKMGERAKGALHQDRPLPAVQQLRAQLEETPFIKPSLVRTILGSARPEYLNEVMRFILEQREKAKAGTFTERDVAKAYVMTLASQRADASPETLRHIERGTKAVTEKLPGGKERRTLVENPSMDLEAASDAAVARQRELGIPEADIVRPSFTTLTPAGERQVRPEEAMGAWFFTPMGRRALDNLERGIWDQEAWDQGAAIRSVYGANIIETQGALDQPKNAGTFTLRNIKEFTRALNEAKGDPAKVEALAGRLQGIGRGKTPFVSHLLGFGEFPTVDAVEIWGWLTGQGDSAAAARAKGADFAKYAGKIKDTFGGKDGSGKVISDIVEFRIREGFDALRKSKAPGVKDLPPEVFGAVMHHWFWDKLRGSETTHEGAIASQRFAQEEPTGPKGEILLHDTGEAIIRLAADADLSTLFHEGAHYLRAILPPEHMADIDAYVHERFGGWDTQVDGVYVAEEWFARQLEAVFAEGRLRLRPVDPLSPGGRLLGRVNRALRIVADTLVAIYRGALPVEVHPKMRDWVAKHFDLTVADVRPPVVEEPVVVRPPIEVAVREPVGVEERLAGREAMRQQASADRAHLEQMVPLFVQALDMAARGEEPPRPEPPVHDPMILRRKEEPPATERPPAPRPDEVQPPRARRSEQPTMEELNATIPIRERKAVPAPSHEGWGPAMLAEVTAEAERIRAIPDLPTRKAAIQKWLSALHALTGEDKKVGQQHHRMNGPNGMAVVDALLGAGRKIVESMTEEQRTAADTLHAKPPEAARSESPRPTAVGSEPAPETAPAPPVPVKPTPPPKPSKATTALQKATDAYVERTQNRVDTGASKRAALSVVKAVANALAERRGEPPPENAGAYLGPAGTDFVTENIRILRDMTDEALGVKDGGAQRQEAALRAVQTLMNRTMPVERALPVSLPQILESVPEPTQAVIPEGVHPETFILTPLSPNGGAHVEPSGNLRRMRDDKFRPYHYRVVKLGLRDLVTSHTESLAERPGYNQELQNRNDASVRQPWIDDRAAHIEPEDAVRPTNDTPATGGPSVWFWEIPKDHAAGAHLREFVRTHPDGRRGVWLVVAGNGRTLAMLKILVHGTAGHEPYRTNLAGIQNESAKWFRAFGMGTGTPDQIPVREVYGIGMEEAVQLAQNSQGVSATDLSEESAILGNATKLRMLEPIAIEPGDVPLEWNNSTLDAFVGATPALWTAIKALGYDPATWGQAKLPNKIAAVRGALLAVLPGDIIDAAKQTGGEALQAVSTAGPAIVKLTSLGAFADAALPEAFRDGILLYRQFLFERTAKVPRTLDVLARDLSRQYVALAGSQALPVSAVSYAIAEALRRTTGGVTSTTSGFANLLRTGIATIESSKQTGMFVRADPVADFVRVLASTKITVDEGGVLKDRLDVDKDMLGTARGFPATHPEAVDAARSLNVAAIQANESLKDLPEEPVNGPHRSLFQNRDHAEAASPSGPIPSGRTVRRAPIGKDDSAWFRAHTATPAGVQLAEMRAVPLETPETMNLRLGYAADTKVYDARDLVKRAWADAIVSPLQATEWRDNYVKTLGTVAVPRERVAAVRARVWAVLGDIPQKVEAAIRGRNVVESAPGSAPREIPLSLDGDTANRLHAILRYLDEGGWAQPAGVGDEVLGMTADDIRTSLTADGYSRIVGALHDAVSGASPMRADIDHYALASNLLWYLFRRPGALLTPQPGEMGPLATFASKFGGFVLDTAYQVVPGDVWAPDAPPHVRVAVEQFRRTIAGMPQRLAEAVNEAALQGAKGPSAMVTAFRSVLPACEGFIAHIRVSPDASNPGGVSDLQRLRDLMFEPGGVSFRDARQFVPHDTGRTAPANVNDVYQHADMIARVLTGYGRRKLDPLTLNILAHLSAHTLGPAEFEVLWTMLGARLHAAERIGQNILISAAGRSGLSTDIPTILANRSRFGGLALDAYEAFYQGRWERPEAPTGPRPLNVGDIPDDASVNAMVSLLGKRPVTTHFWLAETLNRLNVEAELAKLSDVLVDRQYVQDIYGLSTAGGMVPNDTMHALMFSREVADAVTATLKGTDYVSGYGVDDTGIGHKGMSGTGTSSQTAQYAARILIARLGLRPDLLSSRRAIKGEFPRSRMVEAIATLPTDPAARAAALSNPATWRAVFSEIDPTGRDAYVGSVMAQHIAAAVERHAPLGQYLAGTLADRGIGETMLSRFKDYLLQNKGNMITGGPNGWLALSVAGLAWKGGATALGAFDLGMASWALSLPLRMAGYVTNFLTAYMQSAVEEGVARTAKDTLGSPKVSGLAYRASWETVRYVRMRFGAEAARRLTSAAFEKLAGRPTPMENIPVISADGTVRSLADVQQIAEHYGLDGTQARFESAERVQRRYDRMAAEFNRAGAVNAMWNEVTGFFGRYALTENYRRLYEHVDTYFRYVWLIRGLQEGLPPDQAVKRALRISYDYTETAPIDRAINKVFLFWMYQRKSIDLTLAALVEHPHTVLGPLRAMNAQKLANGGQDTDDDYVQQSQTIPDYAMTRPTLPFVQWPDVAGTNNGKVMELLAEPPQGSALKLFAEGDQVLGGLADLNLGPAVAHTVGHAGPIGQFLWNTGENYAGGPSISWFRYKPTTDEDYVVPMKLVRMDQCLTGGKFMDTFGVVPQYVEDPQRRADVGVMSRFVVGASKSDRLAFDAFRYLMTGANGLMTGLENSDISNDNTDVVTNWLLDHCQPAPLDGVFTPAMDKQAPSAIGPTMEYLRNFGIAPAMTTSVSAARSAPVVAYDKALQAATMETQQQVKAMSPAPPAVEMAPESIPALAPPVAPGLAPPVAPGIER